MTYYCNDCNEFFSDEDAASRPAGRVLLTMMTVMASPRMKKRYWILLIRSRRLFPNAITASSRNSALKNLRR